MKPELWNRVEELFHSALEREPSGRAAFLAAACGDDTTLRMEVEALLAADGNARSFLEQPGEVASAPLESRRTFAPHTLGPL